MDEVKYYCFDVSKKKGIVGKIMKYQVEYWHPFCYIYVGGCWGQPMLLFWKKIDKTQMSKPPKCAAMFLWTWNSNLVGHQQLQSISYRDGTSCRYVQRNSQSSYCLMNGANCNLGTMLI